jgi:hypothetical protein
MPALLAAALLLAGAPAARAAQELAVTLDYPSFRGDFYASGEVSFPPCAAPATANILVRSASGDEPTARVTALEAWPDGSVLKAALLFSANAERKTDYRVVFGEDVTRRGSLDEPAVLPTVTFAVQGAPRNTEAMNVNVGELNVRVDRSPGLYYYWHILPIVVLLALTFYRSRRRELRP